MAGVEGLGRGASLFAHHNYPQVTVVDIADGLYLYRCLKRGRRLYLYMMRIEHRNG